MKNQIKYALEKVHKKFNKSAIKFLDGQLLVGSLAYVSEEYLKNSSDIDLICLVKDKNLSDLLNSKYLKGLIDISLAKEILKNNRSKYFFLKFKIDGISFSVDFMEPQYFKEICNLSLDKTNYSSKYGNKSQKNKYLLYNAYRNRYFIKKSCTPQKRGYIIKLPLSFKRKNYFMLGIPLTKMLTNKIIYDPHKTLEINLEKLFHTISKEIDKYELNCSIEKKTNLFFNLIKRKHHMTKECTEKIKSLLKL